MQMKLEEAKGKKKTLQKYTQDTGVCIRKMEM